MDIALQAVYTGTDKGKWSVGNGPSWKTHKYTDDIAGKGANRGGKSMAEGQWQDRRIRTRERWQGRQQHMLDLWQHRTHCSFVTNRRQHTHICMPSVERRVLKKLKEQN